jgi:hypothetical protein
MAEHGMFGFGAVAAGNGVSDLRKSWPIIKRRWGLSADSTPTRQSETAEVDALHDALDQPIAARGDHQYGPRGRKSNT